MKIVDGYKQNSAEWLAYRKTGIGASDAPALMNESPYGTPFTLWGEKTGLLQREEPNIYALAAMERGKKLEPAARDAVEKKLGKKFTVINVLHDKYDFVKASLDGYWTAASVSESQFLEIKCASKVEHAKTLKEAAKPEGTGIATLKYKAQIEQQFLITGSTTGYFASYYPDFPDGEDLAVVLIKPDFEYQKRLLAALIDMWNRVQTKTPPPVGPGDLDRVLKSILPLQQKLNGTLEALRLLSAAMNGTSVSK